jgi:hypothetical protein
MRVGSVLACVLAGTFTLFLAEPLAAQTEEQLAFIPSGGRTLLTDIATSKPPAQELNALLTGKRTRDEWVSYLNSRSQAVAKIRALNDKQRLTLADYLSFHMPLAASHMPANPASAEWTRNLPKDGRDLSLANCQGCHIITVVVTQTRSRSFWVGTMSTPSHAVIKITPEQREEMASYLELNGGIPIELVPEELRAAGATY